MAKRTSSIHLFKLGGIDVFLHWSWFVVALYEMHARRGNYPSLVWNLAEYLLLFAIVLSHEFGHALACRQVGGRADTILLWPLGGVAFVSPPPRPGATLWCIAAGPLVNVVLFFIFFGLSWFGHSQPDLVAAYPSFLHLLRTVWLMNIGLLIFNLLPIYPLDGGQILMSLLWFIFGRARSLFITAVLGVIGALGFGAFAFYVASPWLGLIALFLLLQCRRAFRIYEILKRSETQLES